MSRMAVSLLLAALVLVPAASAHTFIGADRTDDGDCADFAERFVILPAGDLHICLSTRVGGAALP